MKYPVLGSERLSSEDLVDLVDLTSMGASYCIYFRIPEQRLCRCSCSVSLMESIFSKSAFSLVLPLQVNASIYIRILSTPFNNYI